LFLDEIGELPLELQPKLLRAIQDQEFERVGGTRTIRTDVRFVAATNRDLKAMVDENEFRADLYYRLHVFPLSVPPLRARREDILLLTRYFVQSMHSEWAGQSTTFRRPQWKPSRGMTGQETFGSCRMCLSDPSF
jgi:transcriptional regulator with GAF, ATPase, and Fis domain